MNLADVPILGEVFSAGPDDRVFDSLLLTGPLLIVVVALVGRTTVTSLLAIGYLLVFLGYAISKSIDL